MGKKTIRNDQVTVRDIQRRMGERYGSITEIWVPEFQRKDKQWDYKKQNKFINDIIDGNNLFIQPIVVGIIEGNTTGSLLLDGYQRVSTIQEFLNNRLKIIREGSQIGYSELDQDTKHQILNQLFTLTTIDNISSIDESFHIFKSINSGVPLTKFQTIKGHNDLSSLCKLISTDDNIINFCLKLKLAANNKSYIKKNNSNKIDQMLLSAICMSENMGLYSMTKSMISQWEVHYNNDNSILDKYSSKYLDPILWHKIYVQINNAFPYDLGKKLGTTESRIMFITTVLSIGPTRLVNVTNELKELVDNGVFLYDNILAENGRHSGAVSRKSLFNRIKSNITLLKRSSKRSFAKSQVRSKLMEQGNKCNICKNNIHDISLAVGDHVEAYSNGGKTEGANLQVLCEYCNLRKSNKEAS